LEGRLGRTGLRDRTLGRLWTCAIVAGAAGLGVKAALAAWRGPMPGVAGWCGAGTCRGAEWLGHFLPPPELHPAVAAIPILGVYGVVYLALALGTAPGGARAALARVRRRMG
jgi:putative peptidoglycan lipid II flippase